MQSKLGLGGYILPICFIRNSFKYYRFHLHNLVDRSPKSHLNNPLGRPVVMERSQITFWLPADSYHLESLL